jgi:hypothetical protein
MYISCIFLWWNTIYYFPNIDELVRFCKRIYVQISQIYTKLFVPAVTTCSIVRRICIITTQHLLRMIVKLSLCSTAATRRPCLDQTFLNKVSFWPASIIFPDSHKFCRKITLLVTFFAFQLFILSSVAPNSITQPLWRVYNFFNTLVCRTYHESEYPSTCGLLAIHFSFLYISINLLLVRPASNPPFFHCDIRHSISFHTIICGDW